MRPPANEPPPVGRPPTPSWRLPVLAAAAAALTIGGALLVRAKLERDPWDGVPPATRAERELRTAEEAAASGDLERAGQALLLAQAHLNDALAAQPDDLGAARARLAVLDRQAKLAERQKAPELALSRSREALDRALEIHSTHRDDARAALDVLATANAYADRAGSGQDALLSARAALDRAATAVASTPSQAGVAGPLAQSFVRLARSAEAAGAAGAAGPTSAEAVRAWAAAVEAVGRAPDLREAPALLGAAAEAAASRGDRDLARTLDARAIAAAEARLALEPNDLGAIRALEARLVAASDRALAAGDPDAAMAHQSRVVDSRRGRLSRVHVADAAETRRELSRSLGNLGALRSGVGDWSGAEAAHREAVEHSAGLTDDGRKTHLVALGNLAQVQGRLERFDAAREAASRAVELAAALTDDVRAGPEDTLDRVTAELRHARLLRAPGGDRALARKVATAALNRLQSAPGVSPTARITQLRADLGALIEELR